MPSALPRALGADHAYFSKMLNWGTFTEEEYFQRCPWLPGNPLREAFFEVLSDPAFDDPFVLMGNLADIRALALTKVSGPGGRA